MSDIWGLCYSSNDCAVSLPLVRVKAEATLKELVAQVKIIQIYVNDSDEAIEAVYAFPIPARAAVNGFVMIEQDGTRVVGQVEEKAEAREIYESAISEGKQAALMEQQTPDVFRIAVGNIRAQEKVQIELMYATELTEDEENDSVRFHLPLHIGARYGHTDGIITLQQASGAFLDIFAAIETTSPINKVSSPSHPVVIELGPDLALPHPKDLPFSNYARVSLSSETPLSQDFVLTVKSDGLDSPRCVAEVHPLHATAALAFTVVPRFKLPDLPRQEFMFLVDRSGSMSGARIAAAKKALVVMLRSLPARGSSLQIVSFGSQCRLQWADGSRPYNQATLDDATQHVDGMQADYGGTAIRQALRRCFEARRTDCPTSVFLLTDGQAWDLNGVFDEVKEAVARAPAKAYLRVFVLGIGNSASTAMIEGIARVGHGTCMMVGEQETSFTGKIARLLKAARTPPISDIAVDCGISPVAAPRGEEDEYVVVEDENDSKGEKTMVASTLNVFDEALDPLQLDTQTAPPAPGVVLLPPAPFQQSPFRIRTLSPGNRLNVYAILQGRTVPQFITLRGTTEDGSEIELVVPVTLSGLSNAPDSPSAVHTLAARKIIQDIEDGQHALAEGISDDADLLARTVKASIVRLAKTYSISSSHTSFVAVDETATHHVSRGSAAPDNTPKTPRKRKTSRPADAIHLSVPSVSLSHAPVEPSAQLGHQHSQGIWMPWASVASGSNDLTATSSSEGTPRSTEDQTKYRNEQIAMKRAKLSALRATRNERMSLRTGPAPSSSDIAESLSDAAPMDPLETLARLQSFDGRFTVDVFSLVKLHVTTAEACDALGVGEEILATVIAMAYLCAKLGSNFERNSWEAIYDKARAFVEDELQTVGNEMEVEGLQARAATYLV
ncbi:von Willebrand factor type A domain-containing protein [Favolaschia claudopus]|uniref:von Willebrand factor type A domain-containing protein n=1 Tax=Favolaschia claudopus TaxID=2862362 RepID=A0AAW0DTA3_9AGAR